MKAAPGLYSCTHRRRPAWCLQGALHGDDVSVGAPIISTKFIFEGCNLVRSNYGWMCVQAVGTRLGAVGWSERAKLPIPTWRGAR